MMKKYSFITLFFLWINLGATAQDLTLDETIYREALSEVQGIAAPKDTRQNLDEESRWQEAMAQLQSPDLAQNLQGQLGIVAILKKHNPLAPQAELSAALDLHKAATQGDIHAQQTLAIALLEGRCFNLSYPKSIQLALPYLKQVLESLKK